MAETRDSPRADEDAETESGDESAPTNLEVAETPTTSRNNENETTGLPYSSMAKAKPSQVEADDTEVMASTPKPRRTYDGATRRRHAKGEMGSDAADAASPNVAAEAASTTGDDEESDSLDTAENQGPSSTGKLSAVKKGIKRKGLPRPRSAEETYRVSTEDEDRPAKKRSLPKAAQDESSDDTITVAPRSVKKKASVPQRSSARTSKTPASNISPASTPSLLTSRPPKVLLTSCTLSGPTSGWIKKKASVVDEVPSQRMDYVCVTRQKDLPTTAKVLKALVAGKPVISLDWITDSRKEGSLLDLDDYKHPDVQDNGDKSKRSTLFSGKTVFFTTAAMKAYKDNWGAIREVAKEAGALAVEEGTATRGVELTPKHSVLLFGDSNDDQAVCSLIDDHARTVYDKAMFAKAIVRAELDLESDEFKLKSNGSEGKQTRGRK